MTESPASRKDNLGPTSCTRCIDAGAEHAILTSSVFPSGEREMCIESDVMVLPQFADVRILPALTNLGIENELAADLSLMQLGLGSDELIKLAHLSSALLHAQTPYVHGDHGLTQDVDNGKSIPLPRGCLLNDPYADRGPLGRYRFIEVRRLVFALEHSRHIGFDFSQDVVDSDGEGPALFPRVVVGLLLLDIEIENLLRQPPRLAELLAGDSEGPSSGRIGMRSTSTTSSPISSSPAWGQRKTQNFNGRSKPTGGIFEPLLLEPHPDVPNKFRIIDGDRRWTNSKTSCRYPKEGAVPAYPRRDHRSDVDRRGTVPSMDLHSPAEARIRH